MSDLLLELRSLTVVQVPGGVQINLGPEHSFHSETLSEAEMMRLAGLLRLAADEEAPCNEPR